MGLYTDAARIGKAAFASIGVRVELMRPVRDAQLHLATKMREFGIQTLIDVGANIGQFARSMRVAGYRGDIVSIEPLSAAHAGCAANAAQDSRWTLLPRMAVGSTHSTAEINISENLASSSLLDVQERSLDALAATGFVGREMVDIHPLDDVLDGSWKRPLAIKMDTQGFEIEVLNGAARTLRETTLLLVEMSLSNLYEGGAQFPELYSRLEREGFRCIGLTQGFVDNKKHELLQVDGIFVRDRVQR